jgi:hypothetical protein
MNDDLVITGHALERMEERWPKLCAGLTDEEVGRLIQGEVNDALVRERVSHICPLELANTNIARWRAEKNVLYVWTENKERGYVISYRDDGIVVLTTLIGQAHAVARKKLHRHR